MTWEIVVGIATLVSLIITFVNVGTKLSGSITKLDISVQSLRTELERMRTYYDAMEEELKRHDHRITVLETHQETHNIQNSG